MQEVDTLDKNRSTKYARLQSFTKQTKVSMLQCVTTKFGLGLVCSKTNYNRCLGYLGFRIFKKKHVNIIHEAVIDKSLDLEKSREEMTQ